MENVYIKITAEEAKKNAKKVEFIGEKKIEFDGDEKLYLVNLEKQIDRYFNEQTKYNTEISNQFEDIKKKLANDEYNQTNEQENLKEKEEKQKKSVIEEANNSYSYV